MNVPRGNIHVIFRKRRSSNHMTPRGTWHPLWPAPSALDCVSTSGTSRFSKRPRQLPLRKVTSPSTSSKGGSTSAHLQAKFSSMDEKVDTQGDLGLQVDSGSRLHTVYSSSITVPYLYGSISVTCALWELLAGLGVGYYCEPVRPSTPIMPRVLDMHNKPHLYQLPWGTYLKVV